MRSMLSRQMACRLRGGPSGVPVGWEKHAARFDHLVDLGAPNSAAIDALGVELGVKALFLQVHLQTLGERGSVFAGIGDEDARLLRRWQGRLSI